MSDPLDYRSPDTPRPVRDTPRRRAGQAVAGGFGILGAGVVLVLLPLLLGEFAWNKYLVAFGLVGTLLGLTIVLHAGLDLLRGR